MRIFTKYLSILLALSLTGCVTVMDGRRQKISVITEPEGASVLLDGQEIAKTPCVVKLKRKGRKQLVIQKTGYNDEVVKLNSKISPWLIADVALMPFLIVDILFGMTGIRYIPGKIDLLLEEL